MVLSYSEFPWLLRSEWLQQTHLTPLACALSSHNFCCSCAGQASVLLLGPILSTCYSTSQLPVLGFLQDRVDGMWRGVSAPEGGDFKGRPSFYLLWDGGTRGEVVEQMKLKYTCKLELRLRCSEWSWGGVGMFERGELNCEGIQASAKQAERRWGWVAFGEARRSTGEVEGG